MADPTIPPDLDRLPEYVRGALAEGFAVEVHFVDHLYVRLGKTTPTGEWVTALGTDPDTLWAAFARARTSWERQAHADPGHDTQRTGEKPAEWKFAHSSPEGERDAEGDLLKYDGIGD